MATRMTLTSPRRMALAAVLAAGVTMAAPADAQSTGRGTASAPQSSPRSAGGAWSLPDADDLVRQALARIVSQDKPAGIPVSQYVDRRFGRAESIDAVRRFLGRSLTDAAFTPVAGWPDARTIEAPLCASASGAGCEIPTALWLSIAQIERGDLPHEIHLWYTTRFQAPPAFDGQPPQAEAYVFCERWLRVGGAWRYDGFVRMRNERK